MECEFSEIVSVDDVMVNWKFKPYQDKISLEILDKSSKRLRINVDAHRIKTE